MSIQERDHLADIGKFIMCVVYAVLVYLMYQMGIKQGAKEFHQGKWICETALETVVCKEIKGNDHG